MVRSRRLGGCGLESFGSGIGEVGFGFESFGSGSTGPTGLGSGWLGLFGSGTGGDCVLGLFGSGLGGGDGLFSFIRSKSTRLRENISSCWSLWKRRTEMRPRWN